MDGNVKAYKINEHKHEPEILQHLYKNGFDSPLTFTTHLLPVSKGIYLTASVHLKDTIEQSELLDVYNQTYEKSSFIRLRNSAPELNWVVDTNFCDINISAKGKSVIITAAIDNLVKGASGQAMQNMNKLLGWDETTGVLQKELKYVSVY